MSRDRKLTIIVTALLSWYARHARDLPWRRSRDPYAIWVSEVMLQQTQVKTVLPYYERWMRSLANVQALAQAAPERIHKLWEGLGYYTRVRNMQRAARIILQEHNGEFPNAFESVLALPGVGRYTAGAICSIAYNQPRPILDGNVIRVLTRLFGIEGDPREPQTRSDLWRLAEALVVRASTAAQPEKPCSQLNQALMELGALCCTPRQPQCGTCPLAQCCAALRTGRVGQLPNLAPRPAPTSRRFVAFIVQNRGRFLVRQRPAGVVNAHLWEFPNVETADRSSNLKRAAAKALGFAPCAVERFCTIRHTITRYRITLDVFRAARSPSARQAPVGGKWLHVKQARKLPFTSAHRKVLERLEREGETD